MANFLDNQSDAQRFAAVLADYERRLQALERSTQAGYTSIEGGSIDIYDEDGVLKGSVGMQPDGGVALVPVNSTAPPMPTPPTVASELAGLSIGWDGQWDDSYDTPTDFALVQVHVGPAADFTPDLSTQVATVTATRGGAVTVHIDGYEPVWVRLVAQNTAAVTGAPSVAVQGQARQAVPQDLIDGIVTETKLANEAISAAKVQLGAIGSDQLAVNAVTAEKIVALGVTAEKIAALAVTTEKIAALAVTTEKIAANSVTATKILAGTIDATHIKAGSLTADRLSLGTDGNVIADPSFEGAVSEQRVADDAHWSLVAPGNGTPRAVQVDAVSDTAVTRSLTLAVLPAVPGQKLWLSVDYLASVDWNGVRVGIVGQWLDAAGTVLGSSTVITGDNLAATGAWTTLSGVPAEAAPTGTTQLRVLCSSADASAGTVQYDNAACRIVLASGTAGARAEISPAGLQLFDDAGSEAVALVTGRPNYLTLSTDGTPVATIDQDGAAGFQSLAVADSLSVAGTDLLEYLNAVPRGIQAIDYQVTTRTASGTEMGFVELAHEIDPTRMYRFVFSARANPSVSGGELQLRLRDGGDGAPSINSRQMYVSVYDMPTAGSFTAHMEHVQSGAEIGAGAHRFLITFVNSSAPAGQTCELYGYDSSRGYFYIEDVGPHVEETGGYNDGGGQTAPTPKKTTKTYACSWSGSYSNRGAYNSFHGSKCYQGYYSSTNGRQAALIGFPSSLASDLSGAKINKAEVYLYFDHWHANAGGQAVIKAHSHASRPSTFSSDSESKTVSWGRNVGKWVDITSIFDSTRWRGIALDPNSTSSTYYGRARGHGQTNAPRLRVTYTK